jgi:hypothetical protein
MWRAMGVCVCVCANVHACTSCSRGYPQLPSGPSVRRPWQARNLKRQRFPPVVSVVDDMVVVVVGGGEGTLQVSLS